MPDLTKSATPAVKEAVRLYRELRKLDKAVERTEIELASKMVGMTEAEIVEYASITTILEHGKPIVEMCTCGHGQALHAPERHGSVAVPGHGACLSCDCKKYTWTSGQ